MLLRAVALDGTDLDVLREWRTLPELKHILVQRLATVDSVGLDAFFGTYSYCIAVESPSLVSFFLFFLSFSCVLLFSSGGDGGFRYLLIP